MKNPTYFLLIFAFLFSSCSQDSKAIEEKFSELKSHVKSLNSEELLNAMDQESVDYFVKMSELVKDTSFNIQLNQLGEKHNAYLTTRLIYHSLQQAAAADSTETKEPVDTSMVLFFAQINGLGILNPFAVDNFSFVEVEQNKKGKAIVLTSRPANATANIVSKFIWNKEGEDWKINIPSTFSLDEKLLKRRWKMSKESNADTFLIQYLKSENLDPLQFKYRK